MTKLVLNKKEVAVLFSISQATINRMLASNDFSLIPPPISRNRGQKVLWRASDIFKNN